MGRCCASSRTGWGEPVSWPPVDVGAWTVCAPAAVFWVCWSGCRSRGRGAGAVTCAETGAKIPPAITPRRVVARSASNMEVSIRGRMRASIVRKVERLSIPCLDLSTPCWDESSQSSLSDRLFVAAVLAQQLRHVLVALVHRPAQRRKAVVVLGVDIGIVSQQQLRHALGILRRRQV